ncbi:MAG: hypothetical protein IPJ34_26570 [Myxococcales bacterium]|nr:hypothetical protein [Myxococcales bacterium]
MFAKKSVVARRRLARRLKAAASIGLAVAAGTFVACKQKADEIMKALDDARGDVGEPEAAAPPASGPATDAGDAAMTTTKPSSSAMVVAKDAGPAPAFDAKEHKKGMPVPDNLLE